MLVFVHAHVLFESILRCYGALHALMPHSALSIFEEFGHVRGGQVNRPIVLEELRLVHPKYAIVFCLESQDLFKLGVLVPAWAVVIPLACLELARSPWIPHLDEVYVSSTDIIHALKHRVSMTVNYPIC